VQDEETGLVVPPKSPQQLAKAITRIWRDHDLRIRLVRSAKELVREGYSLEAVAKTHLHLFRELISRKVENQVSRNGS
jgi:glycosyltransferase involved in cell wall biosynthesis